ncbi:MAG: hypothetical protein IKK21_00105 [Clostridia bacterium]|nr:hypothetical protein [Clostridia bacterium]
MRYHIDTIPVWDAMKLDGECPLCAMRRKMELSETERYLGASVMEPDVRLQVNAKGFCRRHHEMLFATSNRLGHALMLHTHLLETTERSEKPFAALRKAAHAYGESSLGDKLTGKAAAARKEIEAIADELSQMATTCVLCDSIEENMRRYVHTFFHLFKTDAEFRKRLAEGKGFCLPDAAMLLRLAPEELSAKETAAFTETILAAQERNMKRMAEDIEWFTRKFDYRFDAEPWKNSRDAVERTANKLRGWCIGAEPNPKE